MPSTALIVHHDRSLTKTLANYLGAATDLETFEFPNETQALEWLSKTARKIELALVEWNGGVTVSGLREHELLREARIYALLEHEEREAIGATSSASEVIEHLLVKPFRARELARRIRRVLRGPLPENASALIVDEDGSSREIVRDCLGSLGFSTVQEVMNQGEALAALRPAAASFSLIIATWECNGAKDFLLQEQIRQFPRLAATPLLTITSQLSIDRIKVVQRAAACLHGYFETPFEPKALRERVEAASREVAENKVALLAQTEARRLLDVGDVKRAIDCLTRAGEKLAGYASIFEALGDTYRLGNGDLVSAVAAYEKAIRIDPYRSELAVKLSDAYQALAKTNDVIRVLKGYLYHLGFDDDMRTRLAKVYLQAGDYGAACVELRRALNVDPSNQTADLLYKVASSLEEKQERKAA